MSIFKGTYNFCGLLLYISFHCNLCAIYRIAENGAIILFFYSVFLVLLRLGLLNPLERIKQRRGTSAVIFPALSSASASAFFSRT